MLEGLNERARRLRDSRGFTLLEVMVVMALIVVLASISLVQYRQSIVLAREATLKEDLFRMREALDQFYADKGTYPDVLEELVSAGYLRRIPQDPFTLSATTWQTVPAEPDPGNFTGSFGIYDLKSGSDLVANDGSRYADW